MQPRGVAIVPYDEELENSSGVTDQIMRVASALQTQVREHFAPAWGTTAEIIGCSSLDEVPEGYSTVALTRQRLPLERGGYHYPGAVPGALIHVTNPEHASTWSVRASHELLELLGDPDGTTVVPGPSLGDRKLAKVNDPSLVAENNSAYTKQGVVDYVKELCDPVEGSTYEIPRKPHPITVSDFVLPAFYKHYSTGQRYSHTGRAERPFGLLAGGYISWTTRGSHASVWQAFGEGTPCAPVPDKDLKITDLGRSPALLSRHWLDANPASKSTLRNRIDSGAYPPIGFAARPESYGSRLRTDIGLRLRSLNRPPSSGVGAYLQLIRDLAWDDAFYQKCHANIKILEDALKDVQKNTLPHARIPNLAGLRLADQATYRELLRGYERGQRFGYDFSTERDARLLATMY